MDFIMPVGMSRFFLFDGEKVSELVDNFSEEKLKKAIKTLLGIDVVEQLDEDLKTIINKNEVTKDIETNDNEVKKLQDQKTKLQFEINATQHILSTTKLKLNKKIKKLENHETLFLSNGGAMIGKQETAMQRRTTTEKKLKIVQSEIYEKLSGTAPFALILPLLENANKTAQIERDCEILGYEINGVEQLFKGQKVSSLLQKRFEAMKDNRNNLLQTVNLNTLSLSPAGRDRLVQLCNGFPQEELRSINNLIVKKNELQKRLQNSDDYLSVEVDQNKLNKIIEEMKNLNREITKHQLQLEQFEQDVVSKTQMLMTIDSMLDKLTAQLLSQYEANDNSIRLVKYALMAKAVLGQYGKKIQQIKVDSLSAKVTEKFRAIIGKQKLIHKIVFNSHDLSMELYDNKGNLFNRKQLSAGEQQLLATSIVWGIVECTGQEFPMIIDTPLARLDSTHREQFVDNYIPNAGKQIIIFSTDAEIVNGLEKRINKYVAKKYYLHYDEVTEATLVKEGYFA
jgi:DNA sulfur modification protein DndD